ncbi:MAG TPA: SDR family NAD(P)-dependent oxidoreductase, partial [Anaerovoracaceae bacterium]|nr:SDR family NAD(P)-dependent oxidoreductase [Anaerovoracaceae bacterium]
MKHFSLEQKIAIITGGGSGLGYATAKRFTDAGGTVTIADISDEAENAAVELGCDFIKTDVSKDSDVENLIKRVHAKFG